MVARLASRSSVICSIAIGAAGAIALVVVLVASSEPPQTPTPTKTSVPSIGRCNTKPVASRVPADCMAWVPLHVARPTRVCSDDEQVQILGAYLQLDMRDLQPYLAATSIRTTPIGCRANLPAIARVFVRASLQAMGAQDFPAAEQFVSLATLYGDPSPATTTEVRKALDRERRKICKARHDSRIAQ
ncbi:MAG: hypothetical protein ACKV2T_19595 [Kofleriaceae bacterium]